MNRGAGRRRMAALDARGPSTARRARRYRPMAGAIGAFVGLGVLGVGVVVLRPRRVTVQGMSMEPTLAPGDRLLVVRASRPRPGDLIVVRPPGDSRRVLVKRVSAVLGDEVVVRGDNPVASTDSRDFGPVPREAVVGRVVRRYAPAWRAGPVS